MITKLSEVWTSIERAGRDAGALHTGASDLTDDHAHVFEKWIDEQRHAGMRYLEKNVQARLHPAQRYPWAKSVVSILVPYSAERPAAPIGAMSHHIARYALGDDYHDVLDRILQSIEGVLEGSGAKTWRYVDTGPLSDRSYAAQAGLGWIGRNGMLIHEEQGSFFFIGTLLTSLENDIGSEEVADRCGACTRCIDACPTSAILLDRTISSDDCISYATIEHRGPLRAHLTEHLHDNAFGCDICQEVCPWNHAPAESHPSFFARQQYRSTPLTDLLRYSQAEFSSFFARSAIKRARRDGMRRNVEAILDIPSAEEREGTF